ncbi:hypothetical protein E3N88_41879 [Mikania micrantha]|uniref:Uncharacterized protein n=1 Tax=Mikania micrantha TaxID=192012 RepID=A0A5N6LJK8_9ASTR|nr:hypothetical protein E3N88_41879 [Mikania micrantha]
MTKWHDGRTSGIKVNLPDTNRGEGTFNESQVFGPKDKRQTSRQKVMLQEEEMQEKSSKPQLNVTHSPCPKGSSAQLPTPPGIALSDPSHEWPRNMGVFQGNMAMSESFQNSDVQI